jgi:hypothetical protein
MAANPGGGSGSVGSPAPKPGPPGRTPGPRPGEPAAPQQRRSNNGPPPGEPAAPTRAPGPTPPSASAPDAGLTADQQSADALVNATLAGWGLADTALGQQVWQAAKQGEDFNQIYLTVIVPSQAYQTHFAGLVKLRQQGTNMDEGTYNGVLSTMRDTAHAYGLSTQFTSDEFLGNVIGSHVSPAEWNQRLTDLQSVVQDNLGASSDYLRSQFGVTTGDMMGFWLNPDVAASDIHQKVQASQIGAAAQYAGVGAINPQLALHLAGLGYSGTQAAAGFSKVGQMGQLTQAVGGGTSTVSQDQLVSATFDQNAQAQLAVQRAADERVAAFQAGGQAASTAQGISGLGNANRLNV